MTYEIDISMTQFKYVLESHLVECSKESIIHTEFRRLSASIYITVL